MYDNRQHKEYRNIFTLHIFSFTLTAYLVYKEDHYLKSPDAFPSSEIKQQRHPEIHFRCKGLNTKTIEISQRTRILKADYCVKKVHNANFKLSSSISRYSKIYPVRLIYQRFWGYLSSCGLWRRKWNKQLISLSPPVDSVQKYTCMM